MPIINMLKFKINGVTFTEADVDYVWSITIDEILLNESGILEYEKVQIVDANNNARFETYTINVEKRSGIIYSKVQLPCAQI